MKPQISLTDDYWSTRPGLIVHFGEESWRYHWTGSRYRLTGKWVGSIRYAYDPYYRAFFRFDNYNLEK